MKYKEEIALEACHRKDSLSPKLSTQCCPTYLAATAGESQETKMDKLKKKASETKEQSGIESKDIVEEQVKVISDNMIDLSAVLASLDIQSSLPNFAPDFELPPLTANLPTLNTTQIIIDIGNPLMKLKLFLGFAQCVSFFPITFSTIPFPASFINLSKLVSSLSSLILNKSNLFLFVGDI